MTFIAVLYGGCARLALLAVLIIFSQHALAGQLTLEQAWQLAEQANPALRQAEAEVSAAQGELTDARSFLFNNPVIFTDQGRRRLNEANRSSESKYEWAAGVSQTFEVAGQPEVRRGAASRRLESVQQSVREARYQLRAEVAQRFYQVLSLQQRIASEEGTLRLLEQAAKALGKRVEAGESSRLDGNLATVEAERAQSQLASIRAQLIQARAELAALLQLPAETLPEAAGSLELSARSYSLEE
ncbi:MAG: TolC family protein, partial [Burkholderiales bacterium]